MSASFCGAASGPGGLGHCWLRRLGGACGRRGTGNDAITRAARPRTEQRGSTRGREPPTEPARAVAGRRRLAEVADGPVAAIDRAGTAGGLGCSAAAGDAVLRAAVAGGPTGGRAAGGVGAGLAPVGEQPVIRHRQLGHRGRCRAGGLGGTGTSTAEPSRPAAWFLGSALAAGAGGGSATAVPCRESLSRGDEGRGRRLRTRLSSLPLRTGGAGATATATPPCGPCLARATRRRDLLAA